jgi:uncharacterized protein (UPF0333 family)
MELKKTALGNSGQAALEYILVLILVMMMFMSIMRYISDQKLLEKFMEPAKNKYRVLYQYGHPQATDIGGVTDRVFINPN